MSSLENRIQNEKKDFNCKLRKIHFARVASNTKNLVKFQLALAICDGTQRSNRPWSQHMFRQVSAALKSDLNLETYLPHIPQAKNVHVRIRS